MYEISQSTIIINAAHHGGIKKSPLGRKVVFTTEKKPKLVENIMDCSMMFLSLDHGFSTFSYHGPLFPTENLYL